MRRFASSIPLMLVLAGGSLAVLSPAASAGPGWYVGPWGYTYARYDPGLFGPEKPLPALLEELG